MIVCHEHKFIFVHLKRTSGRSITSALAPLLGPDDIVTPVHKASEDGKPAVPGRNHEGLGRHATALEIRERVGKGVWDEYFKFAIERNPWDKILSRYYAYLGKDGKAYGNLYTKLAGKPLSFEHWFRMRAWKGRVLGPKHYHLPNHFSCYTDRAGELMVDYIGRLENRAVHLAEIEARIGVPIDEGVSVGTKTRKDKKRPYTEFYKPWMNDVVERVFAKDLELLGYRFGEPPPLEPILRDANSRRDAVAH